MGRKNRHPRRGHKPSSLTHKVSRRYTHGRRVLIEERRKPQSLPDLPDGMAWFVVQTSPRVEVRAQRKLETFGFPTFLPLFRRTITRTIQGGGKVTRQHDLALLPGYLFVSMAANPYHLGKDAAIAWHADGVTGILSSDGMPVPVPHAMLAHLAAEGTETRYDADGRTIPATASFAPGDRLTVSAGAWSGLPAEVEKAPDADKLIVLIGCFGGTVRATVDVADVEAA